VAFSKPPAEGPAVMTEQEDMPRLFINAGLNQSDATGCDGKGKVSTIFLR